MIKNVVVVVKGSLSREKREQQEYEVVFPPFSVQFKLPKNKEKLLSQKRGMIKWRDVLISFNNAYLTILVADDRLFTANCCFKLVFVATKVAHRAMTDMLSKGREREIDDDDAPQ